MRRIILTGANGFIASAIRHYNSDRYEFINVTRKEIDFSKPETVYPFLMEQDFDAILHTAANAQTEFCANYPELSHAVNVESAIKAAEAAQAKNAKFLFISTEQVFNGKTEPGPFKEEDAVSCVTNYGNQKIEVEQWLNANAKDYIILRLSSMFGMAMPGIKPSSNFLMRTWNAFRTHTPAKFTPNEQRGMTYVMHLAENFEKILSLPDGTYHVSSVNNRSTYDLCRWVAKELGYSDEEINTYILPDTDRYADRFRDYRLDSSKLKSFGIDCGTVEADLDRCLKDFGWR